MKTVAHKLRAMVASMDTATMEAFGNKGLLRRAQKDLERGIPVSIQRETENELILTVAESEVRIPETGPASATCSCPAPGVCQHILTAMLFLRQAGPEAGEITTGSPAENVSETLEKMLLSLAGDQLESWAGKAEFRAALKMAEQTVEIAMSPGVCIRFPVFNVECRFLPGTGLDGAITSGGKWEGRRIVAASVIAFQKARGIVWARASEIPAPTESEETPRTRGEVLATCQTLLCETLSTGLSRLSSSNQQRWATLAVSALGVNLPRLALELRGISDEVSLALSKDARSDPSRTLTRMSMAYALCEAIRKGGNQPRSDLVGWHRTHYDEVGNLELVGISAWPWRTASGYEGITVLFWEPASKRWNSWTESRPLNQAAGFSPTMRYLQPAPWEGAESPRQLARSKVRVMNAKRNPGFRLSASSTTRVLVTGPTERLPGDLPVFADWRGLEAHVQKHSSTGLKVTDPLNFIVTIKPAAWGNRTFDPVLQAFLWPLLDAQSSELLLELRYDDLNEPAIRFLETVPDSTLNETVLVGRVQSSVTGLRFHPYSIFQDGRVTHLALDSLTAQGSPEPLAVVLREDEMDSTDDVEPVDADDSYMTRLLGEIDEALLIRAERGAITTALNTQSMAALAEKAKDSALEALANNLASFSTTSNPSDALLRCSFLVQCYRHY